jgi:DNA-binding response OmpR family regulator
MTPPEELRARYIHVVEDDPQITQLLVEYLGKAGFKVLCSSSVGEATTRLSRQTFDCVIVDLHLDRGTGEQVIEYMRASPSDFNRGTPVILISGEMDAGVIHRLRGKISSALVKPFRLEVLKERLEDALG